MSNGSFYIGSVHKTVLEEHFPSSDLSLQERLVLFGSFGLFGKPFMSDVKMTEYLRTPIHEVARIRHRALRKVAAVAGGSLSPTSPEEQK